MDENRLVDREPQFRHEQRDQRGYRTYRDQHGRRFGAVFEFKGKHPVGEISPMFTAPVYPAQKYIRMVKSDDGAVRIDYDAWENDLKVRQQEWDDQFRAYAFSMNPQHAVEEMNNPSPALLKLMGPKPPSPAIPQACRQGNTWILGLDPDWATNRPHWADKVLPKPLSTEDKELQELLMSDAFEDAQRVVG